MKDRDKIVPIMARLVKSEQGRIGWILLWLLGVPVPVLVLLFLMRGCT